MSVFAVIPWSREYNNDGVFNCKSEMNRDYSLEPFLEMKYAFENKGHEIHTIDLYENSNKVDYFLFFDFDWEIYKELRRGGKMGRMVYCNTEPPCAHPYNTPEGYSLLKHIYPYILTCNEDWVDNCSVFFRTFPAYVKDDREGSYPYEKKKLATMIASNKDSNYPGELYSERKKAIYYFEENHPDDFDFYGSGWDKNKHRCYRGWATKKSEVYHRYRFSICYENMGGQNRFVDEKIIDCLMSGIVPVFYGSLSVSKWVPKDSYIDFRDFDSYDSLYSFLESIDRLKYDRYLACADSFLKSEAIKMFSGAEYARCIIRALENKKDSFHSSYIAYKLFRKRYGI